MVGPTAQRSDLPSGGRWFAYSGNVNGGGATPAFIDLITIRGTGLRDAFCRFTFTYGMPPNNVSANQLGGLILIDSVEIMELTPAAFGQVDPAGGTAGFQVVELFVPRQSLLEVKSINRAANDLQSRACSVLGWEL